MAFEILLEERGPPVIVSLQQWAALNLDLPMRSLAAAGIVGLTRTPAGTLVTPSHYVGEMRVPGALLRVRPKSEKLLAVMEAMALRARSREARHFEPEQHAVLGDNIDPAGAFVRALLNCVREGVPWLYGLHTEGTSFPRGKLKFSTTVRRFASRGAKHRVIVSVPRRVQSASLVRIVRAAHGCLPGTPGATPKLLADAEALAAVLDSAEPFPDLEDAIAVAETVLVTAKEMPPAAAELAARSLELLRREYATAGIVRPVPGGISRFRNLEKLWERCVLFLVQHSPITLRDAEAQFHGLAGSEFRLFADGGPKLDPDIVTFKGGLVSAVIDAKYKQLAAGTAALADDLYQLTAYVRNTSARLGILIYFTLGAPWAAVIGTTPEGASVLAVSLSPTLLVSEGKNALERLLARTIGVAERVEQSFADAFGE